MAKSDKDPVQEAFKPDRDRAIVEIFDRAANIEHEAHLIFSLLQPYAMQEESMCVLPMTEVQWKAAHALSAIDYERNSLRKAVKDLKDTL